MLGQTLVTKQTGAEGKVVSTLFVAEKMQLTNEMCAGRGGDGNENCVFFAGFGYRLVVVN